MDTKEMNEGIEHEEDKGSSLKNIEYEYAQIPCDQLVEFGLKNAAIFPPHKEPTRSLMLQSVKELGVLESIIVRALKDNRFEIIDSEQRWRYAMAVGLKYINAKVGKNINDDQAFRLYAMLNSYTRYRR
jgi:ParB-like nuclease domain.